MHALCFHLLDVRIIQVNVFCVVSRVRFQEGSVARIQNLVRLLVSPHVVHFYR